MTALGSACYQVGVFVHNDAVLNCGKCLETKYSRVLMCVKHPSSLFSSMFSTGLVVSCAGAEYHCFLIRSAARRKLQHLGWFFWASWWSFVSSFFLLELFLYHRSHGNAAGSRSDFPDSALFSVSFLPISSSATELSLCPSRGQLEAKGQHKILSHMLCSFN